MKSIKYLLGLFAIGAAITATSCVGQLDIAQHSVSSIDTYYSTDDEAEEGIIAVYAQFRTMDNGMVANSIVGGLELLGDDCWVGGGSHNDGNAYMLGDYTFGTDYSAILYWFQRLYTLIYRANVVIENVKGDSAVMQRAVAEAKVFRAWANFELVSLWGPAPLVDHCLSDNEYMQPNATVEEIWAFVEQDLNEAIESGALTQKSSSTDLTYRITKHYAQALLGKAYLFQEKYSAAATILDEVINSGLYALNTGSDYENFGTPTVEITPEAVFEVHKLNDISNSTPNNSGMKWTAMGLRAEKYTYGDNAITATATWGFIQPRKELYDEFVALEGADGYRLNCTLITWEQLRDNYDTVHNQVITDNEGYYNWKYRILASYWGSYFYGNNWNVMRYAEVLLLASEANYQAGNTSKALSYLNEIRNRAQAPEATSIDLETIKTESRLELCFEGHRYQNIIRWGEGATRLAYKGSSNPTLQLDGSVEWTSYNSSGYGFVAGKHELLPFPADEVTVNPNIVQNPGW